VGAGFTVVFKGDRGHDGKGSRTMWWATEKRIEDTWRPGVHEDCQCNEYSALVLRTMGAFPPPTNEDLMRPSYDWLRRTAAKLNCRKLSRAEVVESYSGLLRRRYMDAMSSLEEEPLNIVSDGKLKPFLKAEKFNPQLKQAKPRMIMARSPRFNLELSRYLKPFEHELWGRLKTPKHWGVGKSRVVAKGLNQYQRANLIVRKFRGVADCVCVEVDGAQFEAHITDTVLKMEHSVYMAKFRDPVLQKMLNIQLKLKGTTRHGIKFERPGSRASGDVNTGLGNSIIMTTAMDATMRYLRRLAGNNFQYDMLVDGDNAILFIPRRYLALVEARFKSVCTAISGQEAVIEKPAYCVEHVTFGQSRPVHMGGDRYMMVRDPWKVLSNSFCGYKQWNFHNYALRVSKSIAQCELSLAQGVPVLQDYFSRALEDLKHVKQSSDDTIRDYDYLGARRTHEIIQIRPETRVSFEKAFGIEIERQTSLEVQPITWQRGWANGDNIKRILRSNCWDADDVPESLLWKSHVRCE